MAAYPNDQGNAAGALPVYITGTALVFPAPSGNAAYAIQPVKTAAAAASLILKAAPGNFFDAQGYVSAASFIMLFDSATLPADGTVAPVYVLYQAAAGNWSIPPGLFPSLMTAGGVICVSSTGPFTKTIVAAGTNFISGRML